MNREEMERQMAFILEQQAKFSANLEKLQERDAQWEARMEQWEARMERTDRQIAQLAGFAGTLRDAFIALTEHAERHDREITAQIERGKETDARLDTLILIVERHISNHP